MKNQNIKHFLLWLFAIAIGLLLCSCGARKAEKNRTKEQTQTETSAGAVTAKTEESNVKKTENTIIDDKNETIIEEIIWEPIDPSKPASITEPDGTKTNLTNSKKTHKKTTRKNNTKTDNIKSSDETKQAKTTTKSESKKKESTKKAAEKIKVDRAAWSLWNLLWLLIPIALIWLLWENKTKIIAWFNGIWWM